MSSEPVKKPVALIADDDDVMRLMLSEVAISAGFDVVGVGNGSEAIELAEEIDPDIILLDVNMPELDGYSACEYLRSSPATSLTPIIVVTAKDLTTEDHDRLTGRVEEIVEKNAFSREQLLQRLGKAVAACSINK